MKSFLRVALILWVFAVPAFMQFDLNREPAISLFDLKRKAATKFSLMQEEEEEPHNPEPHNPGAEAPHNPGAEAPHEPGAQNPGQPGHSEGGPANEPGAGHEGGTANEPGAGHEGGTQNEGGHNEGGEHGGGEHGGGEHGEGEEHGHESVGSAAIFFVFTGVLIGVLTRYMKNRLQHGVPYTVIILTIGFVMGAISIVAGREKLGLIGFTLDEVIHINGELFLLLFIPALVFESAFSVNFHIFQKVFGQSLILAGPGVIFNAVFTALIIQLTVPSYNWDFQLALFFGAIVSATDPVAVVALLRDLGASKRLATLIEGESLLNDGSAFVMFVVLKQAIQNGGIGAGEIIGLVFRLSLVGSMWGISVGLFIAWWLGKVFNDAIVETSLTICAAYLAFFIAEDTPFHVSGILTVVFLGVTLSRFQATVSPKSVHGLHHVWHQIEFIANTLIFLISGAIVANGLVGEGRRGLGGADFGYLLIIYIGIHITRFLTLLILFYPMKKIGYGFTWKEAVMLWFGALRGAIGLALALITDEEDAITELDRHRIVFHVAGIVFLTLLINGQLTKYVLFALKMDAGKPHSNLLIKNAMGHLKQKSQRLLKVLKSNYHFSGAKFEQIEQDLPDYLNLITLKEEIAAEKLGDDAAVTDIRHRIIASMRSFYWKQFNEGMTSRQALDILVDAADDGLDANDLFVQWSSLQSETTVPKWLSHLHSYPRLRPLANRLLFTSLSISVELVTAVIFACDRLGKVVEAFPEWGDLEQVSTVQKEIQELERLARKEWDVIRKSYPEVTQAIQTKHASIFMLNKDTHNINSLLSDGIVTQEECSKMISALDHAREKQKGINFSLPDDKETLRQLAFLKHFSASEQQSFGQRVQQEYRNAGETLFARGGNSGAFWVIMHGLVEIRFEDDTRASIGPGALVGAWSALSGSPIYSESCVTLSTVGALKFDAGLLRDLRSNTLAEADMWKLAAVAICQGRLSHFFPGDSFMIGELCETSSYVRLEGRQALEQSALLCTGTAVRESDGAQFKAPTVLVVEESYHHGLSHSATIREEAGGFMDGEVYKFENASALLFDGYDNAGDDDSSDGGSGGLERAITSTKGLGLFYQGNPVKTSIPTRGATRALTRALTMSGGKQSNIPSGIRNTSLMARERTLYGQGGGNVPANAPPAPGGSAAPGSQLGGSQHGGSQHFTFNVDTPNKDGYGKGRRGSQQTQKSANPRSPSERSQAGYYSSEQRADGQSNRDYRNNSRSEGQQRPPGSSPRNGASTRRDSQSQQQGRRGSTVSVSQQRRGSVTAASQQRRGSVTNSVAASQARRASVSQQQGRRGSAAAPNLQRRGSAATPGSQRRGSVQALSKRGGSAAALNQRRASVQPQSLQQRRGSVQPQPGRTPGQSARPRAQSVSQTPRGRTPRAADISNRPRGTSAAGLSNRRASQSQQGRGSYYA